MDVEMTPGVDGADGLGRPAQSDVVFNVVWTGDVFTHLDIFTLSLLRHSGARFRFVANACVPGQIDAMERFAEVFSDRVIDVVEVSSDRMLPHGAALDAVLRSRDDGGHFAFVDPDIFARAPFLHPFIEILAHGAAVVTSGKELWSSTNVRPADHPGVNGEYFFDPDGFVFGSPHFAIYEVGALRETMERWGVGLATAGNDIPDAAHQRLEEMGRRYWIYDTAKVVNVLLQADGHLLVHEEHPELVHVGGVSHFLAPPSIVSAAVDGELRWAEEADWGSWDGMGDRFAVARYTAEALNEASTGRSVPDVPGSLSPFIRDRLDQLGRDVEVLVRRERPMRQLARSGQDRHEPGSASARHHAAP